LFSAQTRTEFFAGIPPWRYYMFLQVYDEASSIAGLGPAWSLNVEMVFYLILPLWAMAAAWLVRRGVPAQVELAVLGLIVVAGLTLIESYERVDSYLARTPPPNAGYFAIGMALAILSVDLTASPQPMRLSRALRSMTRIAPPAIALILAVFLFVVNVPRFGLFRFALLSLVLLPAAFDDRASTVARRVLMQHHVQLIGVLSFGVYLFHRQIALGLRLWFWAPMDKQDLLVAFGAVVALSVALARISYRHLEQPVMGMAKVASRSAGPGREAPHPS
jgi:peptidoglycan/LPS O-acetylase OafA/YrhL